MSIYLHKLDLELQESKRSGRGQNERLETLDASLAANIIQSRLEKISTEISDLEEIKGNQEAKERKEWCLSMQYKL